MTAFEEQQPIVLKGGCECGAVTYYSTALPISLRNCHCRTCRKLAAGPYLTFAIFSDSSILVLENVFHASPILNTLATGAHRGQCDCGTLLFLRYHGALEDNEVGVVASTIDEDSVQGAIPKPDQHIFVKEKASWFDLPDDGVARHEDYSEEFKGKPNAIFRRDKGERNLTVQRISDAVFDPFWSLTNGQFSTLEPFVVTQRLKNLGRELEELQALNWEGDRGKLLDGITRMERFVKSHLEIWRRDALNAMEAIDNPPRTEIEKVKEYGKRNLQYERVPEWRMKGMEVPPRPRQRQWVRRGIDNSRSSGERNGRSSSDGWDLDERIPRDHISARSSMDRNKRYSDDSRKSSSWNRRGSDGAQDSRGWISWEPHDNKKCQPSSELGKESSRHAGEWVSWVPENRNNAESLDELRGDQIDSKEESRANLEAKKELEIYPRAPDTD